MQPNSKEFKKLQEEWYNTLKESGFNDAEKGQYLKKYSFKLFETVQHRAALKDTHDELFYQSKERYFQLAGQFLYEHVFDTELHKNIWQQHAEGLSVREIGVLQDLGPNVIQQIVKHYSTIMLTGKKRKI